MNPAVFKVTQEVVDTNVLPPADRLSPRYIAQDGVERYVNVSYRILGSGEIVWMDEKHKLKVGQLLAYHF